MIASVDEIAACVSRLSSSSVFHESDWPTLFALVRQTVASLPAALYGPDSQITRHCSWTGNDVTIATQDWIMEFLGCQAVDERFSPSAIVRLARFSIRWFVIDSYGRPTPRRDCYGALTEALRDFPGLIGGHREVSFEPQAPFPFDPDGNRSARSRWVTTAEVRRALAMIAEQQPTGWTKGQLADVLCRWAGVPGDPISLASSAVPLPSHCPADELDSTEAARAHANAVGAQLDEAEREILPYLIPVQDGKMTLADASKKWKIPVSTLHDRAQRLRGKIRALSAGTKIGGPAAARAFLEALLEHSAGILPSEEDMK